jgi:hypothetical protein
VPARLNGLAVALFGRPVIRDDGSLDPRLEPLRYQLLTGVGATLAETAKRGARRAVFVVHEFRSDGLDPASLARNHDDYELFVKELTGLSEVPRRGLVGPILVPGRESIPGHVALFIGKVRTYVDSRVWLAAGAVPPA